MNNWSHVLQVYVDDSIFERCSALAEENGLSNSSYIKMLVSRAWIERRGGEAVKITEKSVEHVVEPPGKAREVSVLPAV